MQNGCDELIQDPARYVKVSNKFPRSSRRAPTFRKPRNNNARRGKKRNECSQKQVACLLARAQARSISNIEGILNKFQRCSDDAGDRCFLSINLVLSRKGIHTNAVIDFAFARRSASKTYEFYPLGLDIVQCLVRNKSRRAAMYLFSLRF